MKSDKLWKTVLDDLEVSVSKGNFITWLKPTLLRKIQQLNAKQQIAEVCCPSAYHRKYIEERYLGQIKDALDRITQKNNDVALVVGDLPLIDSLQRVDSGPLFEQKNFSSQDLYQRSVFKAKLRQDFTFDVFAVSSSNDMAHAAAQAISKTPGKAYNPFFLYGGVGVGKTHLIHAIAHEVLLKTPEIVLVSCSGEEFTNEIIDAIRKKQTFMFKKKYRSADLLLIDDIQFIAGKSTVQEEFFYTFNTVQREGGQIILVSDQPPHEINGLEARLRSRFEGGLTIDIQQPNFELRTAIVLIKGKAFGANISMEVAQLIAANIESTRKIEGFLTRLLTESKLRNCEIKEPLVRSLLGNIQTPAVATQPNIRPKEVIAVVSKHFNISTSRLIGPIRKKQVVFPRHLAMYFLRTELSMSFEEIGSLFGGRDHTTIMHAVDKITSSLSVKDGVRIELASLRQKIYN